MKGEELNIVEQRDKEVTRRRRKKMELRHYGEMTEGYIEQGEGAAEETNGGGPRNWRHEGEKTNVQNEEEMAN